MAAFEQGAAPSDAEIFTPATLAALRPGQPVDRFRLEEKLHVGGMAYLWSVSETDSPGASAMPLIMKIPRILGGEDPAAIVGFEVEQMILPVLSGPHVPRFVAKGDFTRKPYIVMERIPGESLRARLEEVPLPLAEVVDIGSRVAGALQDLHRQHLIHLDLKPSNILFRADGSVVFCDFGLSRHDHLPDLLAEEFRLPVGSGPYMSPEQVQFVRHDSRSDLFSLGVILYLLATGQRPFGVPDSVRGLRRRLWQEPAPLRALRSDCPPWLQEVILKCLEVRADNRYQSAAQLVFALQNPGQVPLGERAQRLQTSGIGRRLRRWWSAQAEDTPTPVGAAERLSRHPIVVAAVDIEQASAELLEQLRETVRRIVLTEPGARLACVSVLKTARIGMEELIDERGQSKHIKQLVALQHWARPIGIALLLDEERLTLHVLEAPDVGDAIVDFARRNQVDHIVMGARGSSGLRRYLGSVSSAVVAQSACSVTVVRERRDEASPDRG